jgi:hypothetical protein
MDNNNEIIHEVMVALDRIMLYPDLQMRVDLPYKTINQYAQAMRDGSIFPPIDVGEFEGEYICYDGFLRKMARAKNGETETKARVRKAESRDDIVLWAVQANSHSHLKRSNADKAHSVQQLLDTELGKRMTAVDIAHAAGVTSKMVSEYRLRLEQPKSTIPINPVNSDSSKQTVVTSKGHRRPRKYKKRKPKAKSVGRMQMPKINHTWPTAEEKGLPPPELINQPHPDYSDGRTYGEVFWIEHGNVQPYPLAKKIKINNELALRDIIGFVRDIGAICQKLMEKAAKLPANDLAATLAAMKGSSRPVLTRRLNQHRAELEAAWPYIRALLEAIPAEPLASSETEKVSQPTSCHPASQCTAGAKSCPN